jgi:hypothetical protein
VCFPVVPTCGPPPRNTHHSTGIRRSSLPLATTGDPDRVLGAVHAAHDHPSGGLDKFTGQHRAGGLGAVHIESGPMALIAVLL